MHQPISERSSSLRSHSHRSSSLISRCHWPAQYARSSSFPCGTALLHHQRCTSVLETERGFARADLVRRVFGMSHIDPRTLEWVFKCVKVQVVDGAGRSPRLSLWSRRELTRERPKVVPYQVRRGVLSRATEISHAVKPAHLSKLSQENKNLALRPRNAPSFCCFGARALRVGGVRCLSHTT